MRVIFLFLVAAGVCLGADKKEGERAPASVPIANEEKPLPKKKAEPTAPKKMGEQDDFTPPPGWGTDVIKH